MGKGFSHIFLGFYGLTFFIFKMSINLIQKFNNKKTFSRLKNRDKEVFTAIYDENVKDINRFIYFKVGNTEDANDLTSMVFLKTWNHIQNNSLEDAKTLRALLYKVARNVIIDFYRERSGKTPLSLDDEDNKIEVIDEKTLDKHSNIDDLADIELIKSKLPLIKEEYREVIVLRFVNDLNLEEIADITKKTKGNIRVLIHRALNALKSLIEEEKASN